MTEKVTFYVPVYNAEKTIDLCIRSIIDQSYPVDEIIIIDDNSNDKTSELISKYSNTKIIKNKINLGLGHNRNLGIKNSLNDIVASIDSDVVLDKKWLETILPKLKNNNIAMCGGNMIEKYTDNKINAWRKKYYSQNWGNKDIENPQFLYGCNTILYKKYWNSTRGYDPQLKTNGEDLDFSNKIREIENLKLYYSSESICYHLQDDTIDSLSTRIWRYHSYGYKIKNPSLLKLLKLSLKQLKFFLQRLVNGIFDFDINNIIISFKVFINFVKFEYDSLKKNK